MVRKLGSRIGMRGRFGMLAGATVLILVTALLIPAGAVLPGSPSKFESGNDPTLGLGNMTVDTVGNADWITVADGGAPYTHLQDAAASTSDDSFTPGQKQDTTCPDVEGHKNPPKDDFTDVASYTETNATTEDVYLYGATIRYAANGNASENIELKQGTNGVCANAPQLFQRVAGDKLIAIDYLGGGSAPAFHVLTWVVTGPCNVGSHTAPCWGADVLELDPAEAEGGVNNVNLTAAQNPISDVPLVAGKFAEFGVNLTDSDIIPPGECEGFAQAIWESRASGSSFVSSTKDITIEEVNINNCATVEVNKTNDDETAPTGAVFTLYEGTGTGGTVVGTCTVDAAGDCLPTFTDLEPGTYTIDETTVPAGFTKDGDLPETFTLVAGQNKVLNYTNEKLEGSLAILKQSTKTGNPLVSTAGAVFAVDGPDAGTTADFSVTDNGTLDEDNTIGEVCVSGLALGAYTINETTPPPGYGDSAATDIGVTVADNTDCDTAPPATTATATFTNPPLADLLVRVDGQESGEIRSSIDCSVGSDIGIPTPVDPAVLDVDDLAPQTITCTIVIDP